MAGKGPLGIGATIGEHSFGRSVGRRELWRDLHAPGAHAGRLELSEDATPVPATFVIAAGADDMEHDAAETKLDKSSLHKYLATFIRVILGCVFVTFTMVTRMETGNLREGNTGISGSGWKVVKIL